MNGRELRWLRLALALAFAGLLAAGGQPRAQQGRVVDLELVLAVDASSSVSDEEFDLQMKGLADAFRHEAVLAAIRATGDLGIAVTLIQWSDNLSQSTAVDWVRIDSAESAAAFGAAIERSPRFLVGGSTAIGGALKFALRQMERNGFQGRRKVIDLSGDGRTNQGPPPDAVRDQAVASGVTINALAILNEDLYVDRYYRRSVVGGTGAFVLTASDYVDFANSILLKLIREIAGAPIAQAPGEGASEPSAQLGRRPGPGPAGAAGGGS